MRLRRIEMGLRRRRGLFRTPPKYDSATWKMLHARGVVLTTWQPAIRKEKKVRIRIKHGRSWHEKA